MPQVLVRDVDSTVIDRLRERAKQHGRSLEAELRMVLKSAAEPATDVDAIRRVRALFEGRVFSDSADLIREDRDR